MTVKGVPDNDGGFAACHLCGKPLVVDARFCAHCGTPVQKPGEIAERRLITFVFFDLVGSTTIGEKIDPEDFRELVLDYQRACVTAVEGEGGHIAQYVGDGILAYFGYPDAHEDDAVRAVRASLRAVERVGGSGTGLEMRAGLQTGMVVVGEMGAGAYRMRDSAIGDAPNVASRVQGLAEPGQVVIGDETYALAASCFITEDIGTPPLKGVTRPVQVYRVIGEAEAPDKPPATETPLIGRDAELATLLASFRQAKRREGRVVAIEGEPGVGKSKLIRALHDELVTTPHEWLQIAGSAADSLSPLKPVIDLLRKRDDFGDEEDDQLLRALAGLPHRDLGLEPLAQRRSTMDALVRWFLKNASKTTLVLAVEDTHWLDPTTTELLLRLGAEIANHPVLLVGTTRATESEWSTEARTVIRLAALAGDDARELALAIAGDRLSDELIADVVARTDGVPLFVEEVSRAVAEGATAVPTSLQQTLSARLSRLGEAREVAQIAAVVGRDFDGDLLAAVTQRDPSAISAGIRILVGSGLVEPSPAAPAAAPVYSFRHALVRDVAYDSLLRARRREIHGMVATAFCATRPDLVQSQPEYVAHHYELAGETRSAIDYWTQAAQRCGDRYALTEGIEHATRAIARVRELESSDERDQWEMSLIMQLMRLITLRNGSADPRFEDLFQRFIHLTASKGADSPERFTAQSGLCSFYIAHSRLREALDIASELSAAADRTGRRTFRLYSSEWLGVTQYYMGQFEDSLRNLREAHATYRPDRDAAFGELIGFDMAVGALFHAAYNEWNLGDADNAFATMAEARAYAETLGFSWPLCHSYVASGILYAFAGNADGAAFFSEQAMEMAAENEWAVLVGQGGFGKGRALWLSGEPSEAARVLRESIEDVLVSDISGSTMALTWMAEALLDADDPGLADEALTRAERSVESNDERFFEADVLRMRARLLAEDGRREEAVRELERAVAVARAQGCVPRENAALRQLTSVRAPT
ncbi:MAG TPA: AAA family ATPase [Actinomycetota bacterium]|jgi:class 3 adenylate cyclase/tetratricopeptide (TPR) repeat protein|nr:AAA family ATPase [Actinomycetota bacterium]